MKSYISIAIFILICIGGTSCKRSYDCACYSPGLNKTSPTFKVSGNKSDAEKRCQEQPLTGKYTGTDYICNLK